MRQSAIGNRQSVSLAPAGEGFAGGKAEPSRRSRSSDLQEIKALLQSRVHDLVRELAPDGNLSYGYWIARNPARDDRKAGSFWIMVARPGKAPGAWRDEATGDKGDIIDLVAYTRGLDRGQALKWARAWINFEDVPPAARRQAREDQAKARIERERKAADLLAQNRKRAFACYVEAKKAKLIGSLADRYLLGRGIDLRQLERVPGAIGFTPRMRHAESNTWWPVMVAAMTGPDGSVWAVHRTFLAGDGSGKAPVAPARKIWPSFSGAVMKLARGETGLPDAEAAKHGLLDTLVICEGVEDGLSIALARPDLRVWAAGSLGNVAYVRLPDCCERVIVAADNDWGKPQAMAQLDKALAALHAQGRPVRVARSPIGKDFNDVLMDGSAALPARSSPADASQITGAA